MQEHLPYRAAGNVSLCPELVAWPRLSPQAPWPGLGPALVTPWEGAGRASGLGMSVEMS